MAIIKANSAVKILKIKFAGNLKSMFFFIAITPMRIMQTNMHRRPESVENPLMFGYSIICSL